MINRYWRAILARDTGRRFNPILAGGSIPPGIRYWQRFAVFPILALSILACILPAPGYSSTPIPAPTLTQAPRSPKPVVSPDPSPVPSRAIVSALRSVNVRQEPSKSSRSLRVLYSGEQVELTGSCSGGWAEIKLPDVRAWVDGKYLAGDTCKEE